MIDGFFRPFIGGVFLDESLTVSSRMLEFVFRMFSAGDIAVPADGMAAIPRQLAEQLPRGSIRLRSTVAALDGNQIQMTDGSSLTGDVVVVATESSAAARLLGAEDYDTEWNQTTTLYFAASQPPDVRRMLILRGDESGPIQTATVLSNIASEYAPNGQALVSVSLGTLDPSLARDDLDAVDAAVRSQLQQWFGDQVQSWKRLAVYQVPFGLPKRSLDPVELPIRASDNGIFVCGDHRETPSIQGAMNSGIRVAEAILA
jgi:phytoene dehydrogenase-like protein